MSHVFLLDPTTQGDLRRYSIINFFKGQDFLFEEILKLANNPQLEIRNSKILFHYRPDTFADCVSVNIRLELQEKSWWIRLLREVDTSWFSHESDSCHSAKSDSVFLELKLEDSVIKKLITETSQKTFVRPGDDIDELCRMICEEGFLEKKILEEAAKVRESILIKQWFVEVDHCFEQIPNFLARVPHKTLVIAYADWKWGVNKDSIIILSQEGIDHKCQNTQRLTLKDSTARFLDRNFNPVEEFDVPTFDKGLVYTNLGRAVKFFSGDSAHLVRISKKR